MILSVPLHVNRQKLVENCWSRKRSSHPAKRGKNRCPGRSNQGNRDKVLARGSFLGFHPTELFQNPRDGNRLVSLFPGPEGGSASLDPPYFLLKREFGDRLAFWGAIDTQHVLPFGTPDEVRAEVRRVIDCLGKGGGYVVSSVHNLQREVPPENIIAMFDEARSYGRYQG